MWVIIWSTITVVSILTNNAEGQVGSQSSNLPLTDTGDKKTGEEFFEVKKKIQIFLFKPSGGPAHLKEMVWNDKKFF